ncbi:MAG: 4Fe-4S dicluster domain-containing protein [Planctomycetes bacterium]|nr:4Fe-4S dicluster domain-containing protein [Planctomycetota bacterium]
MSLDRRSFVQCLAAVALPVPSGRAETGQVLAPEESEGGDRRPGVLVDIPNCIGCRKCEFACQEAAGFEVPPIDTFDDKSVFRAHRRPGPRGYTTVNEFPNPRDPDKPLYVKVNCLHCAQPACASACLVGALRKQANGAVTYDAHKCMGCRYCMIACPFQIPAYDYHDPLTPQVRKCTFCFERTSQAGGVPACVKICPNDALAYGPRSELLAIAHQRIAARPEQYVDHVYGEHEVGGTSWLYLSPVPFDKLALPLLGATPPGAVTESIQHAVFKYFVPPLALYALLALVMRLSRREVPSDGGAAEGGGAARSRGAARRHQDDGRGPAHSPEEVPEVVSA